LTIKFLVLAKMLPYRQNELPDDTGISKRMKGVVAWRSAPRVRIG